MYKTIAKNKILVVPSRIELLILALLAPRLNQLGQGTDFYFIGFVVLYRDVRRSVDRRVDRRV